MIPSSLESSAACGVVHDWLHQGGESDKSSLNRGILGALQLKVKVGTEPAS